VQAILRVNQPPALALASALAPALARAAALALAPASALAPALVTEYHLKSD